MIPGTRDSQTVVTLRPSDIVVLYTDGITDARSGSGKDLGRERLLEWAREGPVESPQALGEQLLKRLTAFRGNRHNDDDTLLVLQRERESAPILDKPKERVETPTAELLKGDQPLYEGLLWIHRRRQSFIGERGNEKSLISFDRLGTRFSLAIYSVKMLGKRTDAYRLRRFSLVT